MKNFICFILLLQTAPALFSQNYNFQFRSSLEFPGQTLANICGYAQNGREYALIGGSKGLIIVDVTNPDQPQTITQLPGPDNLWKEIKVYDHYAYVTSEGGQGVQIVDLSPLPNADLPFKFYTGDGEIDGTLNTIHALHIDVTKGFVYLYGSNLFSGGAVVLDINNDPYNPVYAGKYDQYGYIHDGYADNDTLYAAHILDGYLTVVNMADKQNPEFLGLVYTPSQFTHNSWLLSDRKTILTTDERVPSFLTAYDLTDLDDIRETDRLSTGDGFNSIGHNTHILNDWAVTSWYIDGFNIVDAHRPDNLVEVARYDTYDGPGQFDGCWGVYPYLPSGTIIASNIPNISNNAVGKLFVCTPTYVRACYLEGIVTNSCNGLPLKDAEVRINSNFVNAFDRTKTNGVFKTGQATPGNFTVTVSKPGFITQTLPVTLTSGEVTALNVALAVNNPVNIDAVVRKADTGEPIPFQTLSFSNGDYTLDLQTDANGALDLDCFPGDLYEAGVWGYKLITADMNNSGSLEFFLEPGYQDNFGLDFDWTASATGSSGFWERAKPVGTTYQNNLVNPDTDINTDANDLCYVTGNGGGAASNDDVDNGDVTLTSPTLDLSNALDPVLSFYYWFVNTGGNGAPPDDQLVVRVENGMDEAVLLNITASNPAWQYSGEIHLKDYITPTQNTRIIIVTNDQNSQQLGHLVEAGIDGFLVDPGGLQSNVRDLNTANRLSAMPNPSDGAFDITNQNALINGGILTVRDMMGKTVFSTSISAGETVRCGAEWPRGAYIATLHNGAGQSLPLKLIKSLSGN